VSTAAVWSIAGFALVVLGVVLAVDRVRPIRRLDDRPEPRYSDIPAADDMWRMTDDREAAESRLGRTS